RVRHHNSPQTNSQTFPTRRSSDLKTYEKSGYDLSKVAERLIEKGEYQLALDTDESQLEKIITTLYANEDKELISDLNSDNLSERSEEHTSELQSRFDLVCRLLLEK